MKAFVLQYLMPVLIIAISSSCSNEAAYKDASFKNITELNYGTSFGFCNGFCKHDVTIRSTKATYICYSWYPTVQTVTRTENLRTSALDSIYSVNTSAFFNLPETIGCPDCADGGAEWLEIELPNGNKHKVTFEYYNEPTSIKDQIRKLREVLSKNKCN